jgi:hypothetical protein
MEQYTNCSEDRCLNMEHDTETGMYVCCVHVCLCLYVCMYSYFLHIIYRMCLKLSYKIVSVSRAV